MSFRSPLGRVGQDSSRNALTAGKDLAALNMWNVEILFFKHSGTHLRFAPKKVYVLRRYSFELHYVCAGFLCLCAFPMDRYAFEIHL